MNTIRQYRPSFFEGFENERACFSSLEDLQSIPWVAHFATAPGFRRFSVSHDCLMAEYNDGKHWVVGMMDDPNVGLPQWMNQRRFND